MNDPAIISGQKRGHHCVQQCN